MSIKKPNLLNIISETSTIITSHSLHFLLLSLLFIFPNSLAAIIYSLLSLPPPQNQHATAAASVLYSLSVFLFNICSVSSITYTTFHAFHGDSFTLLASLKSILVSFFPLLATMLVVGAITFVAIFCFTILMLVSYNGLALLGLEMDYGDPYLLVSALVFACMMIGVLVYLQVEWYLVNAVVVLESKWGFAPLKRSSNLIKGMRGVIFSVFMLFFVISIPLSVWFFHVAANARTNRGLTVWLILQMIVYLGVSAVLALYGLVANVVVFAHCKEFHEEQVFRIEVEGGVVYAQLPSDAV